MKVKPVKRQNVLVRLAKISKAQKQAAKAAAAEAKLAAQAAQGTDTFVKPGFKAKMKTPKFRNWTIGIVAALGAIAGTTAGLLRPITYKGHDIILEDRSRAYAEHRGWTQRDTYLFAKDSWEFNTSSYVKEKNAIDGQRELDYQAFKDILIDNGYEELTETDEFINIGKFEPFNDWIRTRKDYEEAMERRLGEVMSSKEYSKLMQDLGKQYDAHSIKWMPYFKNTTYQYTLDSIKFSNFLKDNYIRNYKVRQDFEKICECIKPNFKDYHWLYHNHGKGSYKHYKDDGPAATYSRFAY